MTNQEKFDFSPNHKTFSGFMTKPTRLGNHGTSKAVPSAGLGAAARVKERGRKEDPKEASDQEEKEKGEDTTPTRQRPGKKEVLGTTKSGNQAQPTRQ